jgi:hypothetical protein
LGKISPSVPVQTKLNSVEIDLASGKVIVQSINTSLKDCVRIVEAQAKKLTSNRNTHEWGIR